MTDAPRSFERIARGYDLLVNEPKRWANEREAIARWLDEAGDKKRRVLDMGCGTGFHARHIAALLNAKVVGADPAEAILDVARSKEHGDLVRWIAAPAEAPPPGEFDLILLLGNTLSLIADPRPIFEALAQVAANSALFVLQTLDYDALRAKSAQVIQRKGEDVSIEKQLIPHPASASTAATLRLCVRDDAGKVLDEMISELLDHRTDELQAHAAEFGWTLIEELRSYGDASAGSDRILIFRRGC